MAKNRCSLTDNSKISKKKDFSFSKTLKKIIAFTLAESLLTMGILSVTAALTVPGIVASYKKKVTTTRIKNFYCKFNQGVSLAQQNYYEVKEWDHSLENSAFVNKYLTPYMEIEQISSWQWRFPDGSTLEFFKGGCRDIIYDTNGYTQKPNVEGRDRFRFLLCGPSGSSFCDGFCSYRYAGEKDNRAKLLERCKSGGHACSALLEYDNWEFKKDYPYKL